MSTKILKECFYCGNVFKPKVQMYWPVDHEPEKCPKCGDTRLKELRLGDQYGYDGTRNDDDRETYD